MAGPVSAQRGADGVTRVTFQVPEGVEGAVWWRQQVARYGTEPGPTIPAEVEAAWLLECAANFDRIVSPGLARTVPLIAGQKLPPRVFGPRGAITRAQAAALVARSGRGFGELRAAADAGTLAFSPEHERDLRTLEMALAQVSVMREVASGARARVVTAEAAGGEIFTALLVGSVIVAAVALDEYFDSVRDANALRAAADERTARARIAQAGQDYRARLEQLAVTGTMPPPSATETAVQADVARRAQSEWDNFWRAAAGAAGGLGKGAMLAAVAALLLLGGSSRR